ncbi:MAG: hypothetical protein AAGA75_09105 [Cyanobacteria bacterium P01_E01_bin.6]
MAQVTYSYESFSQPDWFAEQLTPEKLVPGGAKVVATAFQYVDQVTVSLNGAVSVDDTSLTVDAIAMDNPASTKTGVVIPSGTNLHFGEAKEFVRITADVSIGDTSITAEAVPTALEDNDTATYNGLDVRIIIPSGTLVGRTFVERSAGTGYGQPDVATPDDELFLTAFSVKDAVQLNDVTLLRHNTLVYEDKLPGWSGLSSAAQAAIRSRYQCIASAAA